jgi:serine/threonine protein kinase
MTDDVIEPMSRAKIGRYQLLKKLAAGGMAEIYLARVTGVGGFAKNVVLKRILPQLAESEQFFRMFLDEARIAATLQHPNVVQVYDAGEIDGQYYIAMEYLDGADLATIRRHLSERNQSLPIGHIAYLAGCVCAGLHYAHDKKDLDGQPLGIVHRDVTPHNVFVTRDGGIKLVDFGIAKASNRLSRTTYGTMKGKIAYMAPEQCEGEQVDRRSDIYALGVVLYEIATGKNPHRQVHAEYAMMKEIVEGTITPPSTLLPSIPPEFEAVIMKATAKKPEDRFQTAREMQMALESYARSAQLPTSALTLSDYVKPLLDSIRAEAESRSERWASEVDAYEEYLHAKEAPAPKRRKRNEPVSELPPAGRGRRDGDVEGLLEQLRAEADAKAQPSQPAAPKPAKAAATAARFDDLMPPLDLDRIDVRNGRKIALAIGVVAVAAAAYAIYGFVNRPAASEAAVTTEPVDTPETRPDIPERGTIAATSTPDGAAVWRRVGLTPIKDLPVTRGETLQLRVVHDGYETEALAAKVATGDDIVPIELEPLDTLGQKARRAQISWRPPGAAPYKPGDARLTITSEPAAATVWVYAGATPDVELADVATDQPHELRFEREGYKPAFLEVTERSYTVNGRAEVHPSLVR